MSEYMLPEVKWVDALADLVGVAGDGDVVVVHSKAQEEAATRMLSGVEIRQSPRFKHVQAGDMSDPSATAQKIYDALLGKKTAAEDEAGDSA